MISKEQFKSVLKNIAINNNLTGEAVELLIDELTYALYHSQLDIANAIMESNLSTAKLMNSKIRNCMNYMYSVYRGKNARVKLNFWASTPLNYNKYDVIFSSNNFKVYAEDTFSALADVAKQSYPNTIIGIISTKDIYDVTLEVNSSNRYFIDIVENNIPLDNISEDLLLTINDVEYNTTRNFYDFINQVLPLKIYDAYQIGSTYHYVDNTYHWTIADPTDHELMDNLNILGEVSGVPQLPNLENQSKESIFILTIPDYGIRLFRRNYFSANDVIHIKAFYYTTLDDITDNEFSKIKIKGTSLTTTELKKTHIVSRLPEYDDNNDRTYKDNGAIVEIARDDENSILYNANFYERVQSKILSRSDVDILFTEYFRDYVKYALNWYDDRTRTVFIFYVRIPDTDEIDDIQKNEFNLKYKSYFISNDIQIQEGVRVDIDVDIDLYQNTSEDLTKKIESIYAKYEYVLNDPDEFEYPEDEEDPENPEDPEEPEIIVETDTSLISTSLINRKQILAEITKLSEVNYINSITYVEKLQSNPEGTLITDDMDFTRYDYIPELGDIMVPTYYVFNVIVHPHQAYEIIP